MSALHLADFVLRKTTFSSSPWRVYHAPTDRIVTTPGEVPHPGGGMMPYSKPAAFDRKRDAVAWMRDVLPGLVAQYNARQEAPAA